MIEMQREGRDPNGLGRPLYTFAGASIDRPEEREGQVQVVSGHQPGVLPDEQFAREFVQHLLQLRLRPQGKKKALCRHSALVTGLPVFSHAPP